MNRILIEQIFRYDENQMFILGSLFPDSLENIRKSTIPKATSVKGIKFYQLQDTISGYVHLQQNWDSYNAIPVSATAIETALEVLSQLNKDDIFSKGIEVNVFPMRDGGIQFEFDADGRHSADLCAELEIDRDGQMFFLQFDADANMVKKAPIYSYDLSEISILLEEAQYV